VELSATVGRYFKIPPYTILGFRNNSGVLVNQNSKYTLNHAVIGLEKSTWFRCSPGRVL
jgi:hypothetical protein